MELLAMDPKQQELALGQSDSSRTYQDRRLPSTTLDADHEAPAPNTSIPPVVIRVYRLVLAEAELHIRLMTLDVQMTRRLGHLQFLQDGGAAGGLALEWELRRIKTIQRWWRRVRRERAHEPLKRVEKPVVEALPTVVADRRRELPAENMRELRILRRMYQTQYRLWTNGPANSDQRAHGKTFADLVPQYQRSAGRYQRERDKNRQLVEVAKTELIATYSVWERSQAIIQSLFVQARDLVHARGVCGADDDRL
ncbi:hypothetical protein AMAG_04495 [Allomyces macrogynus ATCC 38327]|uniref:Uncharacterized protein n=1 Tax=Allomyces macrogynus (strain ATCC 38327) TaxID=578462 RepID=A0A0L0S597_ALLM3|nr:hypothetical protein AMAG_04495 [Allomyces macrogynus ATCC 38327]|eukprot:KNE57630.1 hypothetical protein AMAG_04495 [Allomyces macrogynus ATCC 38327]